jgi:histidine triad (HIT) family protein
MPKSRDASLDCPFCEIVFGRAPSHLVYETDSVLAFLDIHPIRLGHTQIIPREHHAYYDDLPSSLALEVLQVGQRLAPVLRSLFDVQRVAFLFTGGDVAHVHAHVVPIVETTDITSRRYIAEERLTFRSTPRAPDSELTKTAAMIRDVLNGRAPA